MKKEQDEVREEIRDFFNEYWLKDFKKTYQIRIAPFLMTEALTYYGHVYGTVFSMSQLINLLLFSLFQVVYAKFDITVRLYYPLHNECRDLAKG